VRTGFEPTGLPHASTFHERAFNHLATSTTMDGDPQKRDRSPSETMMRVLFLRLASLSGIGLLVLGVIHWVLVSGEGGCEQRQVFAEAISPDGAWVARFYQNVCGGGFGTTYVDDTVEVTRHDEAAHPVPTVGVVFEMKDYFYDQPKPMALRWPNAREIEVTIPNDAWAGTQQSNFDNLVISYRYVPDDPIERACLKQWRTVPTDEMVRRSSSATEKIKAFLVRCHAESGPR
jgi:hypothetical protein